MLTPFPHPIYVTKPFLPSLEEYRAGLEDIWESAWLTNNGPLLRRYVTALQHYLGMDNVCLFTNGTLALQIALQGMELTGEVITTPFTFVATSHALRFCQLRPVFVDIEPEYFTLDPERVEAAITPQTSAILAVHVFGYPCDLAGLATVAKRHGIPLLYDAAHAFGVTVDGVPIARYGDLSMFSFHATKPYHAIEGGMLTFADASLKKTFQHLRNFGFEDEVSVVMPGTNAKMNEFQALMGLLMLRHMDDLVAKRHALTDCYRTHLSGVHGITLPPALPHNVHYNYAYFPIQVLPEFPISRDALYEGLKAYNIFCRRYFYPLVTDFSCYHHLRGQAPLSVAQRTAEQILCLPLYHDLTPDDVEQICAAICALACETACVAG